MCRVILTLMAQLLVLFEDFMVENGATHFALGSHRFPNRPADETFFAQAAPAVRLGGDFVFLSSGSSMGLALAFAGPIIGFKRDYSRSLGYLRSRPRVSA